MALLSALGSLSNLGEVLQLGTGHKYQKETMQWTRRNYALDVQALKIDLLGAARDDVRGTYDTYIERLDTLLLLNALLLPFALNTLQFSDEFVPQTEIDCPHCIQATRPWLVYIWVILVGMELILPFWSILLLLRCKTWLDSWLQHTLSELQEMRRNIIRSRDAHTVVSDTAVGNQREEDVATEQQKIIASLGEFIVDYQDLFGDLWNEQCTPLVFWATRMLWFSAYVAITLTGLMFWIYLFNRDDPQQQPANFHFAWLIVVGLSAPVALVLWEVWCADNEYSSQSASGPILTQFLGERLSHPAERVSQGSTVWESATLADGAASAVFPQRTTSNMSMGSGILPQRAASSRSLGAGPPTRSMGSDAGAAPPVFRRSGTSLSALSS